MHEPSTRGQPSNPGDPDIQVTHPRSDVAQIRLLGEHDLASATTLERAINDALDEASHLVVDLTSVEFIDSTIIHTLVRASGRAERRGLTFNLLVGTTAVVRTVLEITDVLGTLNAIESLDHAIQQDGVGPNHSTNNGKASGRSQGGGRADAQRAH